MVKFFSIVRITFPVLLGYIPLGIAFGILAVSANIPWYYALLMSIFIFAGSGQFLAVALFSSVASYLEIFIALFYLEGYLRQSVVYLLPLPRLHASQSS